MLICFTGIDGSGKSTLAKESVSILKHRGIKSQYVYSKYQPILTKPLISIGRRLFLGKRDYCKNYTQYTHTKRGLFKNRVFSLTYESLLLFDYLFQATMKVKLPLIMGKNVVCDRYVYDTVITDLAVDINYSTQKVERVIRGLFLLLPRPDITFFIDVPEEIAYCRKNDVPSIEYLRERRAVYLDISRKDKMIALDGSKTLKELRSELKKRLS
ncbi:MAG: hypothetical protein OEY81_00190 [Candidatus Bathyarchaeota archaeon]|nr:hypothetical protein [Candidatus Bathyarchaeota archaeon]MDH5689837.1 hypothetical protein [Candidatus Bathyarchaeota archaeon]